MSMIQKIEIDGKQVPFKVSAAIPRIYRIKFHRDIYKDLDALGKAVGNVDEGSSHLDMFSLEMFENIAYIMAKHADPTIPDSPVPILRRTVWKYRSLPQSVPATFLSYFATVSDFQQACLSSPLCDSIIFLISHNFYHTNLSYYSFLC